MSIWSVLGAVAGLCVTCCALGATGVTVRVRRAGLGSPRFTRSLLVAMPLLAIGGLSAARDELRPAGATGWHDVAFLLAGLVIAASLVRHPELGPVRRRTRVLADSMIGALSIAVLLWLLAGRAAYERTGTADAALLVLAIAAGAAITRVGAVITLNRESGSRAERSSAVLTTAFAVCSMGGLLHLLDHAAGAPGPLAAASLGVLAVGLLLIAHSGSVLLGATPRVRLPLTRPGRHSVSALTPIVVAAVAVGAVLADAAVRGRLDATASGTLTVVICSLLLRQSLTLSDNRELSTSLRATVDRLEQQATHDALTGLPNRQGLHERIAEAVRRADAAGTTCAVFFVDVDHLKAVNDSLGHGAGDLLIRATAARLRARVGDRVTRFGGDEFVLVVDDVDGPGAAERLGRTVVEDMAQPVSLDGHRVRSSSSVGLALAEPGVGPEDLLRRADIALYRAKALGRHCVAAYRPVDDEDLSAHVDLAAELRRAVARDEFTLHYQPIVDLGTGEVVAVESLLRWQHPERGLLTPDAFLDEAISAGLLGTIGEGSLRRACADFAVDEPWGTAGHLPSVAVNLSSSELADRRVVDRVAGALADSGLPASRLTLEITEDVIVDERVSATIDRLRAIGVQLAIDDFGTGNSSLRQLSAYRAEALKVDRSFVARLDDDERTRAIVAAVLRLGREFGLRTVAEGVETEAQARRLARLGCERAQGWHIARAMPVEDLRAWCRDRVPEGYGDSLASVASASSMMRPSSSATGGRSSIAPTT